MEESEDEETRERREEFERRHYSDDNSDTGEWGYARDTSTWSPFLLLESRENVDICMSDEEMAPKRVNRVVAVM